MRDLIMEWARPEGVIALGVLVNTWQQWHNRQTQRKIALDVRRLKVSTNGIQTALNESKVAEGRILERDDARDRQELGKST